MSAASMMRTALDLMLQCCASASGCFDTVSTPPEVKRQIVHAYLSGETLDGPTLHVVVAKRLNTPETGCSSHQAHGRVLVPAADAAFTRVSSCAVVLGIGQAAKLRGARFHPARLLRSGNALAGHLMLDLKRQGLIDGDGDHGVMDAFVTARAFDALADAGGLVATSPGVTRPGFTMSLHRYFTMANLLRCRRTDVLSSDLGHRWQ